MQRDIGNEFIVAIVVIGIIAFAIAFAIVLSLSSGASNDLTATPQQVSNVSTLLPTLTVATVGINIATASQPPLINSPTSLPPTKTPTNVSPTATFTLQPASPTLIFTSTSQPATSTSLPPASTSTPQPPTATLTNLPPTNTAIPTVETPTSVAVLPTKTLSSRPSATFMPVPTNTPRPTLTSTPLPSSTLTPTVTNMPSPTLTFTPSPSSTFTPTATSTPSPTATFTSTPSSTFTLTATPSNTPTATPTTTPTPTFTPTIQFISGCPVPPGWFTYTVKPGETLASIARAIGSTAELLQAANCLSEGSVLSADQLIAVPIAPGDLTSFPVQFRPDGCTEIDAYITSPLPGQTVSGTISLIGTASVEKFSYYRIEIRPSSARTYTLYDRFFTPVVNASLAEIETGIYRPGAYWIQLTVVQDETHVLTPCAIPVIIQR